MQLSECETVFSENVLGASFLEYQKHIQAKTEEAHRLRQRV